MAPPGYPKTVSTPKLTKVSQMISEPGICWGPVEFGSVDDSAFGMILFRFIPSGRGGEPGPEAYSFPGKNK